jgi:hypothetical protein
LRDDLGVSVEVALAEQGSLDELANTADAKARRAGLVDRRPGYTKVT